MCDLPSGLANGAAKSTNPALEGLGLRDAQTRHLPSSELHLTTRLKLALGQILRQPRDAISSASR